MSIRAQASSVTVDYEKERYFALASTFRNYVEYQHFSLRLEFGGDGRIVVRQALLGPHSRNDLLCEEKPPDGGFDFLAQARFDLYFVEQCLSSEMPALDIDAIYQQALRDVQRKLDGLDLARQYELTRADLVRLEPWAQAYMSRLLKKEELPDFLVGAWKRHAFSRSECYEAKIREFSSLRNGKDHASCHQWPKLLGTSRFCGPNPTNLIYYTPAFRGSGEQRAIASLDKLGLRECLGNLLSQAGEPSMIDALESFGYSLSWSQQERVNEYAWEIWKSFHVDEWLERTLRAGAVPGDVATVLDDCAHGGRPLGAHGPRVMSERDVQRRLPPQGWGSFEWEHREPTPTEALLESRYAQFMAYAAGFWVTDVTMGPDASPRVAPYLNGLHNDEDLFCQPSPRKDVNDFSSTAQLDLPIVLQCLRADIPKLDVGALHLKAAADAESTLKEGLRTRAAGLSAPDLLELQIGADSQVADALDKSGFFDLLTAAVRRYIGTDSECYGEATSEFERRRNAFFAAGGTCDAPEQLISLSLSMKPDLLNYVDFNLSALAAGPFQVAIEKLQEPGLRRCLRQILAQAGDRDTMEKLGMLQQYPRRFQYDRAVHYAWDLWRERGLEDWIRRTSEAGRVPRHVRAVVEHCAAGKLPTPAQR